MGIKEETMQRFFDELEEVSFIKQRMEVVSNKIVTCCGEYDDAGTADAKRELSELERKLFMAGG